MRKIISNYISILKTLFIPNEIHKAVEDIDEDRLYEKGFRTIFLDIDNTVMGYSEKELSLQKLTWIKRLTATGFKIYIVSNNSNYNRINKVAKIAELTGTYFSLKPFAFTCRDLEKTHNINLSQTLMIGDQLFTDVIGGNWLKAYTILVDPLDKRLSYIKTVQREIELWLINKLSN